MDNSVYSNPTAGEGVIRLLEIKDSDIRMDILRQCRYAVDKGIHIGGAFSAVIPMVSLYYGGFIDFDVKNPLEEGRDVFILSKGHSVATLASIYADVGYFDKRHLVNSRSVDSILNGHPGPILPGVPFSTGPLGQGICVAAGLALEAKNNVKRRVFCMTGDGELQEGSVWEAVMFAGARRLDNLCVIVDKNDGQSDCLYQLVVPVDDLKAKFEAFGWHVLCVDGTKYEEICGAYGAFTRGEAAGRPTVIISNTQKGFGGFAAFTNNHKGNIPDALVEQETGFHQKRREQRSREFSAYYDRARRRCPQIAEILKETARRMHYMLHTDSRGDTDDVVRVEPGVRTGRVPARKKGIAYEAGDLPVLDRTKKYSTSQVITEVMKVFARDPKVVSIDSDLANTSGLLEGVSHVDKNRALNAGIAEANMMCMGEAYASLGYNAWVSTFAVFFEWRVFRRIAISYQERLESMASGEGWLSEGHGLDLTFVATAPNLETQTNGATHMGNDDICVYGGIGHLKIIDISCPQQLIGVMRWIAAGNRGLVYMRVMRMSSPVIYGPDFSFEYGRGYRLKEPEGEKAVIISSGHGVHEAVAAAEILEKAGIMTGVVDMPSVDPLMLTELADSGKLLVFAEQNNGYLYNAFKTAVFDHKKAVDPSRVAAVNTLGKNGEKTFIHSGTYGQLAEMFGLSGNMLAEYVKEKIKKQQR